MRYLLCGYRIKLFKKNSKVIIIGSYISYKEASIAQAQLCGKCTSWKYSWEGHNNIVSWIYKLEDGTLKHALDIQDVNKAIEVDADKDVVNENNTSVVTATTN